jgi:hypothetical protein
VDSVGRARRSQLDRERAQQKTGRARHCAPRTRGHRRRYACSRRCRRTAWLVSRRRLRALTLPPLDPGS